jgi:hypothetical protein
MIRLLRRASWLAPYFALALVLGGSTAATAASVTESSAAATASKLVVNPLSQHASHCYNAGYYICGITLTNKGTSPINWFAENQAASSDNTNDTSYLYGGQYGSYSNETYGTINPGQKISLQLVYPNCSAAQFWTVIIGGNAGSVRLAPQASILNCY